MLFRIALIGLLMLGSSALCGASDQPAQNSGAAPRTEVADRAAKPPWEWTPDERLADRFDRAKIRERQLAYEASHPRAAGSSDALKAQSNGTLERRPFVHGIDGSRNPELFLPYELFDGLLTGLDPDESLRVKQRAYYQVRRLGYNEDAFWNALASASAAYLPVRFGTNQYLTSTAEISKRSEEICRQRYDALEAARALFGRRKFDMLLYTIVARYSGYSEATLDVDPTAKLRRAEKGCR